MTKNQLLRELPKVDRLMEYLLENSFVPYRILLNCCREIIDSLRQDILLGKISQIPLNEVLKERIEDLVKTRLGFSLKRVINATGVVLHTNLGRAVLSEEAAENVKQIAMGYSNLEYELNSGQRGSRHDHLEPLICSITKAQAAMVVNNNAAAVMLALMSLCNGKEVVVSRGELVEIGGSFRVPQIMALSGARLVEVGTTNKTRISDYVDATSQETAAYLKVHTSNFKIVGFCEEVDILSLSQLGLKQGIPVIYDLGSGLMPRLGLDETTVTEAIDKGADLVCFSGDKLFGGPQAGIIAGKKEYIDILKRHQLARALRVDKLTIAALEATLRAYLDEDYALRTIPTLAALTADLDKLEQMAKKLCAQIDGLEIKGLNARVVKSEAQAGGGCAPSHNIPSYAVELSHSTMTAQIIENYLRAFNTPIIVRINKGNVVLDVRTINPKEFDVILSALSSLTEGAA